MKTFQQVKDDLIETSASTELLPSCRALLKDSMVFSGAIWATNTPSMLLYVCVCVCV